jgi:hypothetical protein
LRARRGRNHARPGAPKQLDAELFLEAAQMMAYRAVRQMQFFGGAAEAAPPSGRFKRAQSLQGRKRGAHAVKFYSHYSEKSLAGVRFRARQ